MLKIFCKDCEHYHKSISANGENMKDVCDSDLLYEVTPIGFTRIKTTSSGRVVLKKCIDKNFDFRCEDFSAKNKITNFFRIVFHFLKGGYFGE